MRISTNVVQGTLMCIVSITVVITGLASCLGMYSQRFPRLLSQADPNLSAAFNPSDAAFAGPVAISGIFISMHVGR